MYTETTTLRVLVPLYSVFIIKVNDRAWAHVKHNPNDSLRLLRDFLAKTKTWINAVILETNNVQMVHHFSYEGNAVSMAVNKLHYFAFTTFGMYRVYNIAPSKTECDVLRCWL